MAVIDDFIPQGGKHCITNSLKQIFTYYNHPISEAMLFGIASGLSFLYINQANSPMINGRTKVFEFEKKIAERLNIEIKCKSYKNYDKVFNITKQLIDQGQPLLIYVDMPYMKYLNMNPHSHFGGHAVVMFGYDDQKEMFWISDRDNHDFPIRIPNGTIAQDYHLVSYGEVEKARNSSYRPFPANNKYLTFDFKSFKAIDKLVLKEAIMETCQQMLHPPAKPLGIDGILKFSKEICRWKQFDVNKLRLAGITNYFQIHQDGGTGGGIFRRLYGEFLKEVALLMAQRELSLIGERFIDISIKWDALALDMWKLSETADYQLLSNMSTCIYQLYCDEKQLYQELYEMIGNVDV